MALQRLTTPCITTPCEENALRSVDQLKVGHILAGAGFRSIWLITDVIDGYIGLRALPLSRAPLSPGCAAGNHVLVQADTFGQRCACGYLLFKVEVNVKLNIVVTEGPPAAYVIAPPAGSEILTPRQGVIYTDGTLFLKVKPDGNWTISSAGAAKTVQPSNMPLLPHLWTAWEAPEAWQS